MRSQKHPSFIVINDGITSLSCWKLFAALLLKRSILLMPESVGGNAGNVRTPCTAYIFRYLSDNRKIPQPFDLTRIAGSTPDWIRTSDLQSRSLTLYPTELRARSHIILAQKRRKIKGYRTFFSLSSFAVEWRMGVCLLHHPILPQTWHKTSTRRLDFIDFTGALLQTKFMRDKIDIDSSIELENDRKHTFERCGIRRKYEK